MAEERLLYREYNISLLDWVASCASAETRLAIAKDPATPTAVLALIEMSGGIEAAKAAKENRRQQEEKSR